MIQIFPNRYGTDPEKLALNSLPLNSYSCLCGSPVIPSNHHSPAFLMLDAGLWSIDLSNGHSPRSLSSNFFARLLLSTVPRAESARHGLKPILELLAWYVEILDRKGSIAKHLYMPLFSSRIEDKINGSFSSSHPYVLGLDSDDSRSGVCPSWIDLIQESISKDHFEICDDCKYRYSFGGITVEMSKTDCDALSSNELRKLLQAPPEPEDVQSKRPDLS